VFGSASARLVERVPRRRRCDPLNPSQEITMKIKTKVRAGGCRTAKAD
jgi:hypothetical protein